MLSVISLCVLPIESKQGVLKGWGSPGGTWSRGPWHPEGRSIGFVFPYKPDPLQTSAKSRGCGAR